MSQGFLLVVSGLTCVTAVGLAHLLNPAWFLQRFGKPYSRNLDAQVIGAILAAGAGYFLYKIVTQHFSP